MATKKGGKVHPKTAAKPEKKIAIVGCSDSKDEAPYDDDSWELWAMNNAYSHVRRRTAWFEIHPVKFENGTYWRRKLIKPGIFKWATDFRGAPVEKYLNDLAILDVVMDTKYEGFEVAKTMAGDKQLDDIPILMLTSIDILTTSRTDMHAMVREFRKSPNFEGLDVLLVKNQVSGTTAVDYVNEKGENVFFNVAGFLPKPIDSAHILPEIKRILGN